MKTSSKRTTEALGAVLMALSALAFGFPHAKAESTSITLEYNSGRPYLSPIASLPGTSALIPYYDEAGFRSKPLGPIKTQAPYGFAITGPGTSQRPQNGTAYIQLLYGSSYEVFGLAGEVFDAISIDLAEYSTVYPVPMTIGFVGTRDDGSAVSTFFRIDGIIGTRSPGGDFETFMFPESFHNIVNLRATNVLFSLDNLKLRVISKPPEIIDASASLSTLWPPNNKMITVGLDAVVSDDSGEAEWSVAGIECNEACPDEDMELLDGHTVNLRAARSGRGSGRVYTVWLQASDADENLSDLFPVEVIVPHDQRNRAR